MAANSAEASGGTDRSWQLERADGQCNNSSHALWTSRTLGMRSTRRDVRQPRPADDEPRKLRAPMGSTFIPCSSVGIPPNLGPWIVPLCDPLQDVADLRSNTCPIPDLCLADVDPDATLVPQLVLHVGVRATHLRRSWCDDVGVIQKGEEPLAPGEMVAGGFQCAMLTQ